MTLADLQAFFGQPSNLIGTAIVSTIVSGIVLFLSKIGETSYKLNSEYKYEQRKKLRDVIARFHGRLLNHSNSMNYRMWNLYQNQGKGWLTLEGEISESNYYFLSFAHRLLNLLAIVREFEEEAIVIDSRIASKGDLRIYNYVAAIRWCMTDAELFTGLDYDSFQATDHFFSDSLRQLSDEHRLQGGRLMPFKEFVATRVQTQNQDEVLEFLNGLCKSEDRYRWDRMVVLHLLLVGLINAIGHSSQKTGQVKISRIASQIVNVRVLSNLRSWLPRHDIPVKYRFQIWLASKTYGYIT